MPSPLDRKYVPVDLETFLDGVMSTAESHALIEASSNDLDLKNRLQTKAEERHRDLDAVVGKYLGRPSETKRGASTGPFIGING